MSSIYSAASADSVSDSKEPACELSSSARLIPTAPPSSPIIGPRFQSSTTSEPSKDLTLDQSTLFAADSPAKTSARRERVLDWTEAARVYGQSTGALLAKFDPS